MHFNPSGAVPTDTQNTLLGKILTYGGTGGGGTGVAMSIGYSGPPLDTPPAIADLVVDTDGRVWVYWGGAWH